MRRLLLDEYATRFGVPLAVHVADTKQMSTGFTDEVSVFPYKIEVDPTRRHVTIPPASVGSPSRIAMALDMHLLITVWPGSDSELQLEKLERCMGILDEHAVLTEDRLDPAYTWAEDTALRLSLEALSVEDLLRIWDGLGTAYQLSVPYVVRTVRAGERDVRSGVDVRTSLVQVGHRGG